MSSELEVKDPMIPEKGKWKRRFSNCVQSILKTQEGKMLFFVYLQMIFLISLGPSFI